MSKPVFGNPAFFKVMLVEDLGTTMKIPPLFKKFGEMMKEDVIVTIQGGRKWKIKMRVVGGEMYFQEGWERFISDNEIDCADFLVFFVDGHDGFNVKIFTKLGCEKEQPVRVPIKAESSSEVGNQEINLPRTRKRKGVAPGESRKSSGKLENLRYSVPRVVNDVDNENARKAARAIKYTHPHFITECGKTRYAYMRIPDKMVVKYKLNQRKSILLQDPNGTSWSVKLTSWADRRIPRLYLASGLTSLYEGNGLKEGDVCTLEFVQDSAKFDLHIFRAQEYAAKKV